MARNFLSASTQYIVATVAPPVTAPPFTMAAWAKPQATTVNGIVLGFFDSASTTIRYELQCRSTNAVRALHGDGTTVGSATTTATGTTGTWQHCCAVFSATNSRTAYINGANPITETTSVANSMASLNRISSGRSTASAGALNFNGDIAEAAVWDVALNTAEIASLAAGTNPKLIRPQNLLLYVPIYGAASPEPNLTIAGSTYNMTLTNSPATAAHVYTSPHTF